VSAERTASSEVSEERFYRFERRFGSFSRTIALPQGTSDEAISADYKDGVLEVRVRKPEQKKPRRIEIGGVSEQSTIEA
jgi:HSP20 family protein